MVQLLQISTLRVQMAINTSIAAAQIEIIKKIPLFIVNVWDWAIFKPNEEDFYKHALNIKSWILERGYSNQIIDSRMGKVKFGHTSKKLGVKRRVLVFHLL